MAAWRYSSEAESPAVLLDHPAEVTNVRFAYAPNAPAPTFQHPAPQLVPLSTLARNQHGAFQRRRRRCYCRDPAARCAVRSGWGGLGCHGLRGRLHPALARAQPHTAPGHVGSQRRGVELPPAHGQQRACQLKQGWQHQAVAAAGLRRGAGRSCREAGGRARSRRRSACSRTACGGRRGRSSIGR